MSSLGDKAYPYRNFTEFRYLSGDFLGVFLLQRKPGPWGPPPWRMSSDHLTPSSMPLPFSIALGCSLRYSPPWTLVLGVFGDDFPVVLSSPRDTLIFGPLEGLSSKKRIC